MVLEAGDSDSPVLSSPPPPPPPPFLRHSFKKPHYHYGWNWPFLSLINVIIKGTNSCLLSSLFLEVTSFSNGDQAEHSESS